jgi:hypothetical protein
MQQLCNSCQGDGDTELIWTVYRQAIQWGRQCEQGVGVVPLNNDNSSPRLVLWCADMHPSYMRHLQFVCTRTPPCCTHLPFAFQDYQYTSISLTIYVIVRFDV